jgi:hypothetical protein
MSVKEVMEKAKSAKSFRAHKSAPFQVLLGLSARADNYRRLVTALYASLKLCSHLPVATLAVSTGR